MGTMSKTTRNNLLVVAVPLLIAEGLMIYPVFFNNFPLWQLLVPISLLTLLPVGFAQDAWESGSYSSLMILIAFDAAFLWTMAFSIRRNHKVPASICLSAFILLSIGIIAGGS